MGNGKAAGYQLIPSAIGLLFYITPDFIAQFQKGLLLLRGESLRELFFHFPDTAVNLFMLLYRFGRQYNFFKPCVFIHRLTCNQPILFHQLQNSRHGRPPNGKLFLQIPLKDIPVSVFVEIADDPAVHSSGRPFSPLKSGLIHQPLDEVRQRAHLKANLIPMLHFFFPLIPQL